MLKFTKESVRRAMMEQKCQGQEGHAPKSYHYKWDMEHAGYIRVQCRKCNMLVALYHSTLEKDVSDPAATPPYIWGDG